MDRLKQNKIKLQVISMAVVFGLLAILPSCSTKGPAPHRPWKDPKWLAECIKESATIKVGSTRAELLKVYTESGGISQREHGRFVYRKDDLIFVEVDFEPIGKHENPNTSDITEPTDKITKITKPAFGPAIID
jgi:hypothetical protein